MTRRSNGVTVLAFLTVVVAIFSQYAAISLLLTGRMAEAAGPLEAGLTLVTGVAFLGLTAVAYAAGFGLWFRRAWATRAAALVYITLFAANVSLAVLYTNLATAVVMTVGSATALVYLRRPAVRAEIEGVLETVAEPGHVVETNAIANPVH
jgi:hypothetical protein